MDFDDVLNDRELDIFVTKINQDYLDKIRKKILNEKYAHLEKEHHCRSDYIYLKMAQNTYKKVN